MSLKNLVANANPPLVSFEFSPPKTDEAEVKLWEAIKRLEPLAPAFVSVHAHSGASYGAGPEVWVYRDEFSGPDPRSMALAESVRSSVAATYGRPVRIREGRIALVRPAYHGPNVAACLVEVGSLADPRDERRLRDPSAGGTIGAAIAPLTGLGEAGSAVPMAATIAGALILAAALVRLVLRPVPVVATV